MTVCRRIASRSQDPWPSTETIAGPPQDARSTPRPRHRRAAKRPLASRCAHQASDAWSITGSPSVRPTMRSGTDTEDASPAIYGTTLTESGHQSSATTRMRSPALTRLNRSTKSGGRGLLPSSSSSATLLAGLLRRPETGPRSVPDRKDPRRRPIVWPPPERSRTGLRTFRASARRAGARSRTEACRSRAPFQTMLATNRKHGARRPGQCIAVDIADADWQTPHGTAAAESGRGPAPVLSACGHPEPRPWNAEAKDQRQFAPGVGPRRQCLRVVMSVSSAGD